MKRLYFCWPVKPFYRLSTKLNQKYNIYHSNHLKVMYKSLSKSNFNFKKIMIEHIHYLKHIFIPSTPHTQNFVCVKICSIIIIFTSITIWKRLVLYYSYSFSPIEIWSWEMNRCFIIDYKGVKLLHLDMRGNLF